MSRTSALWLAAALLVPLLCWLLAPAGADWAGTDDRINELAQPAGTPMLHAPELTPETERALFLAQSASGVALLGASLWTMKSRRGRNS